jgi:nickel-type superoxide dismutase maturation protease
VHGAKGGLVLRAALLLALTAAALAAGRRLRRYEVRGESMRPTFQPGDFLLVDTRAYAAAPPIPGDLVLATHPYEPGIEVVKRVAEVDPDRGITLLGDNSEYSTDSRHYGPVPASALIGRVLVRYWPITR